MSTRLVVRNMTWLASIQAANLLATIVAIPLLSRALLPVGFGDVMFALAVATFLSLICDYGFGWSGLQTAAKHRDDPLVLKRVFSAIMAAKLLLLLLCAALTAAILAVPSVHANRQLIAIASLSTVGSVLMPSWYLQGIERIHVLACALIPARLAGLIAILAFVRSPDDAALATFLMAFPPLLAGVVALAFVRRSLNGFLRPATAEILAHLKQGGSIFLSTLSMGAYTTALTIIVGALGGPVSAGYYAAAERCLAALKAVLGTVAQAALPRVAHLSSTEPQRGIELIRQLARYAPLLLVPSAIAFLCARQLAWLIFGDDFVAGVAPLFRILAPIPILLAFSACFANLYMFNYGWRRCWSRMLLISSALSIVSMILLHLVIPVEQAAAAGALAAEAVVCLVSSLAFLKDRPRWRRPASLL